ncbi:hypothetical protein ACIRPU_42435 [Streptomyces sp. NPDC102259]|uniref:hypothetical protein n=1 Tax=Streptomyces sp. NPDC102259 TaxID=3366148 RepID=UPI003806D31A
MFGYKTKRPAPLTCYECDWRLHLVHKTHSAYDLWFLRHANQAPHCEARAAGDGMAHHLLKLDLATTPARQAGALNTRSPLRTALGART